MFGIEKLRKEVFELRESIISLIGEVLELRISLDLFKDEFRDYRDNEVSFSDVQIYLNGAFKDFSEKLDEKFKVLDKARNENGMD